MRFTAIIVLAAANLALMWPVRAGEKPFELYAERTEKVERPYWIPAHAYAVEEKTARYHRVFGPLVFTRRLPDRPSYAHLSRSVSKYWRGVVPNPCIIRIEPDPNAPEGNFVFYTPAHRKGPRGWLQYAGLDKKGKPHYRYWLDRP
jgi:hypothetical protein